MNFIPFINFILISVIKSDIIFDNDIELPLAATSIDIN